MDYYDSVKQAADAIGRRARGLPAVAVVLGSGLGDFAGSLGDAVSMSYSELPHWPVSKVIGHEGRLVVGTCCGRTIAALSGGQAVTIQLGLASPGPPGRPDIMTTR